MLFATNFGRNHRQQGAMEVWDGKAPSPRVCHRPWRTITINPIRCVSTWAWGAGSWGDEKVYAHGEARPYDSIKVQVQKKGPSFAPIAGLLSILFTICSSLFLSKIFPSIF